MHRSVLASVHHYAYFTPGKGMGCQQGSGSRVVVLRL